AARLDSQEVATGRPAVAAVDAQPLGARPWGHPGSPAGQVATMQRLQRLYGNQAVQRLVQQMEAGPAPARATTTPAASPPGVAAAPSATSGPIVQRWHDAEHMDTTRDALNQVGLQSFVQLFNQDPRYSNAGQIRERLADASVNMDRFVPHPIDSTKESHNVGRLTSGAAFLGSTALGAASRGLSSFLGSAGRAVGIDTQMGQTAATSRGVIGEGPDHGEAGKYYTAPGTSAPDNKAREDYYIDLSVDALQAGDIDLALNKLGDAAHVSADRGSHGEGDRGRGHDTPPPPPGVTGTQMPNYMEKFDDCDNKTLNQQGYNYGVARTREMFQRFLADAT
ncbi:MAG: hypothetical protein ACRDJN_02560, partial [Chloroflexota bacterium]